ncbi:hypothetical protein [Sphingobacterium sp. CZ-2]|uniref:hypothetical protein n=1 Tax=Sphingobacterium sp. CZ-2 TaxID=2557994 RepID=UPI00106FE012|nr:hypothetical protein [Sphingobacterium sp. CZ-2]QBR13235.1 hypothetical protein E3D81_14105 [Sphingobacterium sp. CZ-2]
MKRHLPFLAMLPILLLGSCQFEKSVKKNFRNYSETISEGIGVDHIKIIQNGKETPHNLFEFADDIRFVFNDVTGLKEKEGRVYPKMSMKVVSSKKETVFHEPDLLAQNLKDGTDLKPLQLTASLVPAFSTKDSPYDIYLEITDENGKGKLDYHMRFDLIDGRLLFFGKEGLDYEHIYLYNENKNTIVRDGKVDAKDEYTLMFEGISGLQTKDGMVYPALMVDITDSLGKKVLHNPNVLQQLTETGMKESEFLESKFPVTIRFKPYELVNPCALKAVFEDKISGKKIRAGGLIHIEY